MIKAVFIDIDGTLKNSKKEVSKKTKIEIERCIQKDIKIILTSGRSEKETIEHQQELKTSPYIISSNGASCYDIKKEQEFYSVPLKRKIIQQLFEFTNKNGYNIKFNYKDKIALSRALYQDEKDKEKSTEELKKIIQNERIIQCVILNSNIEKMKELKEVLKRNFPETKIVNESKRIEHPELEPSKNYYCDVVSTEVSKGRAVCEMCKYLNLKEKEIMTIGDGENDISMFNITPYSVVMGNALDNVKKYAKYETATNDEDGVAKMLEKL